MSTGNHGFYFVFILWTCNPNVCELFGAADGLCDSYQTINIHFI